MADKSTDHSKWAKKYGGPHVKTSLFSKGGRHNLHATDGNGHHFSSVYSTGEAAHEAAQQLRGGFKGKQAGNSSGSNTENTA